jgi:hypothetical protein
MKPVTDTIVSNDMTTRDTYDILMAKIMEITELGAANSETINKSLDVIMDILMVLDKRISRLEKDGNVIV